ncbi:hypothetical protein BDR22DRAFT_816503 [Usnea florida]
MPRSFKISFPLPRRASASPHSTPGSQYSNQSNIDDSPLSHPGAKAEKVLGASEGDGPELKKNLKKGRNQLRKYPSFMSVTLSDVDAESVKTPNEFPFPGMHNLKDLVPHPKPEKTRQGSSPLSGELHTLGSADVPRINPASPQAHRAESFSTLRSHYDPKSSPLSISQQTSASSARDMSLRKGYPSISGPLALSTVKAVQSSECDALHSRNISTETKTSGSSKLSSNSIKRINSIPRRRPSIMDPPTLYPDSNRAFQAVSPPSALIDVSLPKPLSPQKSSFGRPRWWTKAKTQMPPSPPCPVLIDDRRRQEDFGNTLSSIKVNVKKPNAQPNTGVRNWFDGLDDEGTLTDSDQDIIVLGYQVPDPQTPPVNIHEIMTHGARPPQIPARKSSLSNDTQSTTLSDQKPNYRLDNTPVRSLFSGSSSQALEETKPPTPTPGRSPMTQTTTSSKGLPLGMDLQSTSFLELSSSEDEKESNFDAPYRRHHIRASIEKASYNNEVSVGNAQRAQPIRPRPIVNGRTRPVSRRSDNSEKVPPVPRLPDKPRLSQRTSSVRWREMDDKSGSTESTVDSGESCLNGSMDSRKLRTKSKQTIRRSKFMKVTSEEEKLLVAMRDKRASIHRNDFDKGIARAIQLQESVARPKTAGADGRAWCSSNYGSRSSTSPLLAEHAGHRSRTEFRFSASAEDLRLEGAYPFPEVPFHPKAPFELISPPKTSPSLSFSPSDILPETPASHDSPITPPLGHSAFGAYGRGLALSPARGVTAMNKGGHDKKEVVINNVGVEQQAHIMDDDGVSPWAMDKV